MKVKHVAMIIVLISIFSILAGCADEKNADNQDKDNTDIIDEETDIVLVNYSVVTQRWTPEKGYETIANGFVYSDDANRYLIRGEVLNNGTENISKAYVYMTFYDSKGHLLYSLYDMIFNFKPGDIETFDGDFTEYDSDYFDSADHVTFTFMQE